MPPKKSQALAEITLNESMVQEAVQKVRNGASTAFKAAKEYGVNRHKVLRRLRGIPSALEAMKQRKKLSDIEDKALCEWVVRWGILGWAPTKEELEEHASMLAKLPFAPGWANRFLERHKEFSYRRINAQTEARIWALTLPKIEAYYELVS
ncbi:hypothetical protein FA10DRAFT_257036 [Acaromyces ingoldii]|uniref:HTH CENPB-type domain-containing protein n=1 Tax=Acaromyces ingoldii TaxID=215250 RepID=A0A316YEG5_9BASI|nr:hypothetical protein FA10DRAFT_257036 [Acaromyces ingoldii]PWN86433.1 hypothetical protein FA10DRAFT_257036 [Acaromyces ingoldii]